MRDRALKYGLSQEWISEQTQMLHQWHPTSRYSRLLQNRKNALRYRDLFASKGLDRTIRVPPDDPDLHVYHQYVIDVPRRDEVAAALKQKSIGHAVYYPVPLPAQPCFAPDVAGQGPWPVAMESARTGLALPIFPELTEREAVEVVDALAAAVCA